jgi:hypothetical protein
MLSMSDFNLNLTSLIEEAEKSREGAQHPALLLAKPKRGSGMKDVPLVSAAIPSLLSRAKLSSETRRREELRLKKLAMRKKKGKGERRSKGRQHWRRKALTKKKANRRLFEASAGFGAILRSRGYKEINPVLWDKYIGECFREYSPKYLEIKKIKRYPGKGDSAYYGTKDYPLTVYSYRVHHKLLGVVYDGKQQMIADGLLEAKEKPAG